MPIPYKDLEKRRAYHRRKSKEHYYANKAYYRRKKKLYYKNHPGQSAKEARAYRVRYKTEIKARRDKKQERRRRNNQCVRCGADMTEYRELHPDAVNCPRCLDKNKIYKLRFQNPDMDIPCPMNLENDR